MFCRHTINSSINRSVSLERIFARRKGRRNGEKGIGTILSDFEEQRGWEDTKSDIAYTHPSRGAMVIFIYEETTMKREPRPGDKPRGNLLGFPQVEFAWSACPGRVKT